MYMDNQSRTRFLYFRSTKVIWYVIVLGWALLRTFAVKTVFEKNGVNPWLYLALDLAASIPYAHFTHKLVLTFLEKNWPSFKKAVAFSVVTFYIPDIYILISARQVPAVIYGGFFIVLATFSLMAVLSIYKKVKPQTPK